MTMLAERSGEARRPDAPVTSAVSILNPSDPVSVASTGWFGEVTPVQVDQAVASNRPTGASTVQGVTQSAEQYHRGP
jgi:hypothetical protein